MPKKPHQTRIGCIKHSCGISSIQKPIVNCRLADQPLIENDEDAETNNEIIATLNKSGTGSEKGDVDIGATTNEGELAEFRFKSYSLILS